MSGLDGVGQVSTALPPVRAMALRPQYGRNDASVATRGAYLPPSTSAILLYLFCLRGVLVWHCGLSMAGGMPLVPHARVPVSPPLSAPHSISSHASWHTCLSLSDTGAFCVCEPIAQDISDQLSLTCGHRHAAPSIRCQSFSFYRKSLISRP